MGCAPLPAASPRPTAFICVDGWHGIFGAPGPPAFTPQVPGVTCGEACSPCLHMQSPNFLPTTTTPNPAVAAPADAEALEAFQLCSRLEGIIPALETSHALAYLEKLCPTLPDGTRVVLNFSGWGGGRGVG